jgi:quercetin dioxygenase-like cupin family protein
MTTQTEQIQSKSFAHPDQTRTFGDMARIEVLALGETTAARATMQPGFHWTEHARPIVGTDLCQVHHVGYVLSGRARARLADGTEQEVAAGDVFDVPPGHDMWVLGDEPYVSIEIERGGPR